MSNYEIITAGRIYEDTDWNWLDYEYEYAPESECCDSDGFINHFGIIKRE